MFGGFQTSPFCTSDKRVIMIKLSLEHWWNVIDRETRITGRKTCPRATFSTTNPTRIDPRSKPLLFADVSAPIRPIPEMAT